MNKRHICLLIALASFSFLLAPGFGQPEQTITTYGEKVRFWADHMEYDQVDNIMVGKGNFHLIQGTAELHADHARI
ncbi:MAG: hypothetical protein GF384_08685, partial [Elusimicrobia bacterium]|nr:hypothetical protein [Elusimicrobiota bacterium]MBD3412687.1 hypothetical protein [Elusimicrobiota bacterium]